MYKQLSKHIRRLGLSSGDPVQKLQEADQFLRNRYKTTNNDGKFAARVDAMKMDKTESPASFVERLQALFDEGVEIGIQYTPYQVKQLFLQGLILRHREQACSVWPKVINVNKLANLLTDWNSQRRRHAQNVPGNMMATDEGASSVSMGTPAVHIDNNNMATSPIRRGNCYRCNKTGHRSGVCRSPSVFMLSKRCSKCGDFGHTIADCMRTLLTPCPRGTLHTWPDVYSSADD